MGEKGIGDFSLVGVGPPEEPCGVCASFVGDALRPPDPDGCLPGFRLLPGPSFNIASPLTVGPVTPPIHGFRSIFQEILVRAIDRPVRPPLSCFTDPLAAFRLVVFNHLWVSLGLEPVASTCKDTFPFFVFLIFREGINHSLGR